MESVSPDNGGWISGPAIDRRDEYSPTSLVLDVRAVLERAGLNLDHDVAREGAATIAAAALLQALGVRPTPPSDRGRSREAPRLPGTAQSRQQGHRRPE